MEPHAVAELSDIRFLWDASAAPVLDIERFMVGRGERLLLRGPSGSGKSTLLGILAGVLVPQRGDVRVLGADLRRLSGADRDRFRADHVGVIFQLFNLIPYLSVLDNVMLPCGFSPRRRAHASKAGSTIRDEAMRLLHSLDMDSPDLLDRPVTGLSVGQQQRVAAARALIGAPELVIADEPTSALDADRRAAFVDLLLDECAATGASVVFVSHDDHATHRFDRIVDLRQLNRPAA